MQLILCDGFVTLGTGNTLVCTGTIATTEFNPPVEYSATMATEAIFQGFMVCLPIMAVVFGGRFVLSMFK